ncbi:MAG: methionine--tRNA ligase, partial [Bacteroidia bacterium]|nr:methionine--tRNA ligase [Bacteroidia bacterium]
MRYLITAALPYANGGLHIGHLAGVYVPADIYVRYLRLKGHEVKFICGSDEHGVPITLRARDEGKTPQEVVDKYHDLIDKSFKEFGISFDIYHRTSSKLHHETAQDFFTVLNNKNQFIERTSEQYFDVEANMFLADRYIKGTCPNCKFEEAYGDQCENCGRSLSPQDLIDPKSQLSGSSPIRKETRHWYLPLDKIQEAWLEKWIDSKEGHWKKNVFGQCKSWLNEGLNPRAVTRDLDWGVKVPVEDGEGKVLYVWFDAPIGYISATKALTDDWKDYWQSEDSTLIHFLGKDNIVFHTIIFPAMLKAHGDFILPENIPANEFLNLEGKKLSTSRNWAVWLHEYLEDFKGKNDELRYVLTSNMPETKDNNFYWKDRKTPETTDSYQAKINNELVAVLGNFVNRTLVLTKKFFDNKVPLSTYDEQILNEISSKYELIENNIETFNFRLALTEAMNVARIGNKYLADNEPWKLIKTNKEGTAHIMHTCLLICAHLGNIFEVFLPDSAKKIREMLNCKEDAKWAAPIMYLSPEHELGEAKLLFAKVEDEDMDRQLAKLVLEDKGVVDSGQLTVDSSKVEGRKNKGTGNGEKGTGNRGQGTGMNVKKAETTYEDFVKLEMRVGIILEAEKVPKTDKLLKLLVDTGIDKRVVVSGIAGSYSAEDVVGMQVTVLLNLKPRKIRGVESQGMILMAEDADGNLSFVQPDKEVDTGSEIS